MKKIGKLIFRVLRPFEFRGEIVEYSLFISEDGEFYYGARDSPRGPLAGAWVWRRHMLLTELSCIPDLYKAQFEAARVLEDL